VTPFAATAETVDAAVLALLDARFAQRLVALPGGAAVAVRSAGHADASAVVLLHGISSGAASWLHCALEFAPKARVIAWDAPGYGESTPLRAAKPSAADYAARLHALLTELRIDSCVLVGHSLGALIAAAYASGLGRAAVRRLVLISPARGYGAAELAAARAQTHAARLAALRERGVEGIARDLPARLLSAAATPADRAWVRWNAARMNPYGYAQAVEMLCADDIERHADLTAPVEVHVGDADVVTPPEACRRIAVRFGAAFATITDAGHASPVEQPGRVVRLVAAALAHRPTTEERP